MGKKYLISPTYSYVDEIGGEQKFFQKQNKYVLIIQYEENEHILRPILSIYIRREIYDEFLEKYGYKLKLKYEYENILYLEDGEYFLRDADEAELAIAEKVEDLEEIAEKIQKNSGDDNEGSISSSAT